MSYDDTEIDMEFALDLDMTGVERAGKFVPAPTGDYDLVVEDMTISKKVETGNISVKTVFSIEGGDEDGKKIFHNLIVAGPASTKNPKQSKKYVKAWADAVTGENTTNISLNKDFFDSCIGNHCSAHVKEVEDNRPEVNEKKNVIGYFLFDGDNSDPGFVDEEPY